MANLALVKRVAALLAVLLLALSAPAVAIAQFGGPSNVPEGLTPPQDEPTAPKEEDTGLSTRQLVLIFGGAAGVLAVIAWLIMRDARGAAPAGERGRASSSPQPADGPSVKKSAREREREKARKRNRAKAARNQRKRNRPR